MKSEIAEDVAEVWFISESMVICTTVFFSIFTYGCFSPNRRLPYIDNEGFRKLHNRAGGIDCACTRVDLEDVGYVNSRILPRQSHTTDRIW